MKLRRLATLVAAGGVLLSGLGAASAATATAAPPKEKCDPPSGMRVEYSSSGREKVNARGCVEITRLEDGQWQVTGVVHAEAYRARGSNNWRLIGHRYQQSCTIATERAFGGFYVEAEHNTASASVDGTTAVRCLRTTLPPGTYVFNWTYDLQADAPGSAVSTEGEVTFTIPGARVSDIIVRPMPHP